MTFPPRKITRRDPRFTPITPCFCPAAPTTMKGAFGGKTGYTSLAGNTLVTFASRNGMTLVAVVLNGHQTHYSDTKAMLDFGFSNFQTSRISDLDSRFSSLGSDMSIAGLPTGDLSGLALEEGMITLPLTSSISDADVSVTYDLGERAPDNAIAQVQYTYNDRVIGSAYLLNRIGEAQETTITLPETTAADSGTSGSSADGETPAAGDSGAEAPSPAQSADGGSSSAPDSQNSGSGSQGSTGGFAIPSVVWIALAVAVVIAAAAGAVIYLKNPAAAPGGRAPAPAGTPPPAAAGNRRIRRGVRTDDGRQKSGQTG